MKSRAFMIFIISAIVTLIAFPDQSRAVTFPITYSGLMHYKYDFTTSNGSSTCQKETKFEITLFADGTLTGQGDQVSIYVHSNDKPPWCEINLTGKTTTLTGTHDSNKGTFTIPMASALTGTYNDDSIKGSMVYGTSTTTYAIWFDLPATNQPPKITLEPATYPEFQMNILEGKGFYVKIRKEDGVIDSQGNWKLNWSTLIFATDGVDNSMNFVKKITDIVIAYISEDGKEIILDIIPNQKYFMLDHNVFNIQSNGVHKIGFHICDTDAQCGKTEYNLYFGPFFSAKSVRDMRCTDFSYSLELTDGTFGNIGYPSLRNTLYIALQNAVYPDNIWSYYDSSGYQIWEEGSLLPVWDNMIALATGDLWTTEYWFLNLTNSFHYNENKKQEFPAGDYIFYAVPIDNDSGALGGFFSQTVKTCLSGIDDM